MTYFKRDHDTADAEDEIEEEKNILKYLLLLNDFQLMGTMRINGVLKLSRSAS